MAENRGRILYLPEIQQVTGMPEGTLRFKHHRRELPFMWKLGRRLVCWSRDLEDWLDEQRELTSRT